MNIWEDFQICISVPLNVEIENMLQKFSSISFSFKTLWLDYIILDLDMLPNKINYTLLFPLLGKSKYTGLLAIHGEMERIKYQLE